MGKMYLYAIIAILIFVIGFISGISVRSDKLKQEVFVPVYTPDTCWERIFDKIKKVEYLISNLGYPKVDTIRFKDTIIIIDSITQWKDIPIRSVKFRDSIPVYVNNDKYSLPFDVGIVYKGKINKYNIKVIPKYISVDIKQKKKLLEPYANIGIGIDVDKELSYNAQAGILFFNKLSISGETDIQDFKPKAVLRLWLK